MSPEAAAGTLRQPGPDALRQWAWPLQYCQPSGSQRYSSLLALLANQHLQDVVMSR